MKKLTAILMSVTMSLSFLSPQLAAYGAVNYKSDTANDETIDFTVSDISGDLTELLQDALDTAADEGSADDPYVIKLAPGGSYTVSRSLKFYSNTTLIATGATITNMPSNNIVVTIGKSTQSTYSYDEDGASYSFENISIIGGTWDGAAKAKYNAGLNQSNSGGHPIMQIGFVSGFTLEDATLQNVFDNHHAEFAAVDNLTVKGCTFDTQYVTEVSSNKNTSSHSREALELDVSDEEFGSYNSANDEQKIFSCSNVTITDCTFNNVVAGAGSHRSASNKPYTNVIIKDNVFKNIGNKYVRKLGGVTTAKMNNLSYENIGVDLDFVQNSKVSGNTISSDMIGVLITENCNKTSVESNTIKSAGKKAIVLRAPSLDKDKYGGNTKISYIKDNIITSPKEAGISVSGSATYADVISGNTVSSCANHAINIFDKGSVGSISNNIIKSPKKIGILVITSAKVENISANKITSPAGTGINVTKSAKVKTIDANRITGAKTIGISINYKGYVTNIKNNSLPKTKKQSILVMDSGRAVNICSNTLSSKTENGIFIKGVKTLKKIQSNNISNCKKCGIQIQKSKSKKLIISKNTISDCKNYGIFVYNGSKIKSVKNNKITGCLKKVVVR